MKNVTFLLIFLALAVVNVQTTTTQKDNNQRRTTEGVHAQTTPTQGNNSQTTPHPGGDDNEKSLNRPLKYIIELRTKDSFVRHCGVSQLNTQWYFTAAECVNRTKYDSTRMLGFDMDNNIRRRVSMWVEERVHPDYDEKTKANNIALIRYYPSKYRALPLRVPSTSIERTTNWNRQIAFISGWSNWPEAESLTINNMVTTITNPFWCKLAYRSHFNEEKHLCVSGVWGNKLSQDDVGAPLVVYDSDDVKKLIGIATDIRPFTNAFPMPLVFTKVEPYVEWILKETNELREN